MNSNFHGIMNIYYENYNGKNKGKYCQPYCINCRSYEKAVEFIAYLKDNDFLLVQGLAQGYCAVLVNLELRSCSGIRLACHYTSPDKELDYVDFEPILEKYLEKKVEL